MVALVLATGSLVVTCVLARYITDVAYTAYAVLLISWLLYTVHVIFIYPYYFSPFRNLPEPKVSLRAATTTRRHGLISLQGAYFPWYHAKHLNEDHNEYFRHWVNTVPNDGILRLRVLFNQERLLLTSPEVLKEVLVVKPYDFAKPEELGSLFKKLLGNGVLIAEGDAHKHQRKVLLPAFAFRHIKDLYPKFWQKARQSTDEIAKASRNITMLNPMDPSAGLEPQFAYDWASRTTLDIIGQSGIGHDFNSVGDPDGDIVSTYRKMFDDDEPPQFRWIALGIMLPVNFVFNLPLPMFAQVKESAAAMMHFARDIVKKKRVAMEKGDSSEIDILSVAMNSGQLSDDEVVDQMLTFIAAGHETTASALTWAMYVMCEHPEIQERLRQEIRSHLPSIRDEQSVVSALQVDKLPYLNAVCNEVLRLIPTVPGTIRVAKVDTTILNHRIPRSTRLLIAPWAMNAKHQLWGETALQFDPERWMAPGMANTGGAKNNFGNLTFLHGPRSCIGKDFAKSEFLCILAAWMGRFEVRWPGDRPLGMQVEGWVTSYPKHKMPVTFRDLDGW